MELDNFSLPSTSQPDIAFIKSKRGKPLLLYDGYEHTTRRHNKNGSISWRCVNRSCKGAIITDINNQFKKKTKHSICRSNVAMNEIKLELFHCKQQAASAEGKPIPTLYNESLLKVKDRGTDLIEDFPTFSKIKTSLYNARNKSQNIKKSTFNKAFEVEIPKDYKDLVLFDYGYKNTRILGFVNKEIKENIKNIKYYLGDGTFKCVIKPFKQLYVIYGDLGSTDEKINVIPLIYVLLMDKKESTYETMFSLIKSQIPDWEPTSFRTDYEKAAINGIRNVFPTIVSKGCYYHFSKALWKKAKELNLTTKKIYKKHVALCSSLALLPSEYKADGWLYIMEDCPQKENVDKFNDYFVSSWLDNQYMHGKWDFYGDIYRTNNPAEGCNAKINRCITGKLNIISFLRIIKKDADLSFLRLKSQGNARRPDDIDRDKIINDSIKSMLNGTITIGHCLEKICPFVF